MQQCSSQNLIPILDLDLHPVIPDECKEIGNALYSQIVEVAIFLKRTLNIPTL